MSDFRDSQASLIGLSFVFFFSFLVLVVTAVWARFVKDRGIKAVIGVRMLTVMVACSGQGWLRG